MELTIKPLSPDLIDDFLYYFDKIGFSDNPDWSSCYCYFYHFPGSPKEWMASSKQQNREASKNLILTKKLNGFLAYDGNTPIGWINVDFKSNYLKLPINKETKSNNEHITASIVCILIAPAYRKKGLAGKLLKESLKQLQKKGIRIVESYPRKGKLSDAHSYHGTPSLYEAEGFEVIQELEKMYVMQKRL